MSPLQSTAPKNKYILTLAGTLTFFALALVPRAIASQPVGAEGGPAPCATIENYRGSLQLFDETRTRISEPSVGGAVSCGGWISVEKGRVELKHREGYRIHLGSHTFAQLPENNPDGKYSGDAIVIFRGEAFAQAKSGAAPLKVLTAAARTTLVQGSVVVLFDQISDESQTVVIEGKARMENRFQPSRKVMIAAGEASSLNFRQVRVVPSLPRALALATLRPRLQELGVSEKLERFALNKARERGERKFASELDAVVTPTDGHVVVEVERSWGAESLEDAGEGVDFSVRAPASVGEASKRKNDATTQKLKQHFVRRLAGGIDGGERTLFSGNDSSKPRRVKLEVVDPSDQLKRKKRGAEDAEKKRLIEELSQIRIE